MDKINTTVFQELETKLAALFIAKPTPGRSVSVKDFGAKADDDTFCNAKAFADALNYCRLKKIETLIIPKGIYHFKECTNDAHLDLDHMEDFILDGQGSELIFETLKPYLSICSSQKILVRDLILDWNWEKAPLSSVGVVSAVAQDGSFIECSFPAYQSIPEHMHFTIVGPFDPYRYTPGCKNGMEFRPYRNDHVKDSGDALSDARMQEIVRELSHIFLPSQQKTNANTMRFYTVNPDFTKENFHPGDCFNFRHYEYSILTVPIRDTTDCTLERVTIYSSPGNGFVGNGDIRGLRFAGCKVTVRPGTSRSISTVTDCLHVCNSQGNFIIEDCDFGYAGDDCINIHDNSSMGIQVLDAHSLLAKRVEKDSVLFEEGYAVELRNPDLSPTGFSSVLKAVQYIPKDRTCMLTFEDALPDGLSPDTVLWNRRFSTQNYIIRNCRFSNNRARGVLLQGSAGLLENNIFENIQGAAIQIETGCESRWSEGHGVNGLIIRNNVIRHCDLNAWQMAVLYMGVYLPDGRTQEPVFENILIEGNSFIDCPRQAAFLSSCQNVIVRNNVIINALQLPLELPCYGSSTMEKPIYGEQYQGVIQFVKASCTLEENNHIFSTLLDMPVSDSTGRSEA